MANGRYAGKPVIIAELGGSIADVDRVETFDAFMRGHDAIARLNTPTAIRGRLENVLLNFAMAAGDRHGENSMVVGDGEGILPIDFGRAFTSPYTTLTEYLETVQHERTGGWLNLRESIKDAITRDELTREEVREWITEWTIGMQQALLGNWVSIVKDA